MQVARLLFVTSVDESNKLVCQAPGCGRAIAVAVHVIRDETGSVRVVGSGCYAKLAGHERATEDGAVIAGFEGRRLSAEERSLMLADTAAFVAQVEARLAEERLAAELADRKRVEARELRGKDVDSENSFHGQTHDAWNPPQDHGSATTRHAERRRAQDQLARYRAHQASQAARAAMQRSPELAAHSLDVVSNAMIRAKAQYLSRGLRMDAPGAREAIEAEALALLAARAGDTAHD